MVVSTAPSAFPGVVGSWRITNVNVNISSSSPDSLSSRLGDSGPLSWSYLACQQITRTDAATKLTMTNSTGEKSPPGRVAATFVAGNSFGTTVMVLLFRGFVITREDMLTSDAEELR